MLVYRNPVMPQSTIIDSDPLNGLRETRAVGSMSISSTTLTLTAASTFQAGDGIIVEIGGEAGAGALGTTGVGGKIVASDAGFYYLAQDQPISLVTTVVARNGDGSVLTLADTAVVATTNADIYFDNRALLNGMMTQSNPPSRSDNQVLFLPAGDFAISGHLQINYVSGWSIIGAGIDVTILRNPKGCPGAGLRTFETDNITISDFTVIGNWGEEGFYLDPNGDGYGVGVRPTACNNALVQRIKVVDVAIQAVWLELCSTSTTRDCEMILTQPLRAYSSNWYFGMSDATDCLVEDCVINSEWLCPGFETFRSSGSVFRRISTRNAGASSNSSGDFLFDDCEIRIEAGSQYLNSDTVFNHLNPAYNINSNIQPPDASMLLGGTILNCDLTVEGYIDTDIAKQNLLKGIVVNADNPNITIIGGLFDYQLNGAGPFPVGEVGPYAVNSTAENCNVSDMTVTGSVHASEVGSKGNIMLFDANSPFNSGTVTNCTTDSGVYIDGVLQ